MKIRPTLKREKLLWAEGYKLVGGADEVGRGAWAGPVVASVVILPSNHEVIAEVADSKQVTAKRRLDLYHQILEGVIDFGVGVVNNHRIDQIGIGAATKQAFSEAIEMLKTKPEFLLVDGFGFETECRLEPVVRGDQIIYSISCASIIAKVFRDNIMTNLDESYGVYQFDAHKGYGTKKHQELLAEHGPSDIHRFSYAPIRGLL